MKDNMICKHGLSENNCALCRAEMNVKPKIRLVDIAPREIPMENPTITSLMKEKTMSPPELYDNTILENRAPLKPLRSFNLATRTISGNNSLFQTRLDVIEEKYGRSNLEQTFPEEKIINLKKELLKT